MVDSRIGWPSVLNHWTTDGVIHVPRECCHATLALGLFSANPTISLLINHKPRVPEGTDCVNALLSTYSQICTHLLFSVIV